MGLGGGLFQNIQQYSAPAADFHLAAVGHSKRADWLAELCNTAMAVYFLIYRYLLSGWFGDSISISVEGQFEAI